MLTETRITKDAIRSLCNLNDPPTDGFFPAVQLIELQKKIPENQPAQVVWRLVFSDGRYFCESTIGKNLFPLVDRGLLSHGGLLTKHSFIKLTKHNTATVGKTIVVVVQDLVIIENPGCFWVA